MVNSAGLERMNKEESFLLQEQGLSLFPWITVQLKVISLGHNNRESRHLPCLWLIWLDPWRYDSLSLSRSDT